MTSFASLAGRALPGRLRARFRALRVAADLASSTRGATAVEFALASPVLILLMLGSVELGRFIILNQKLMLPSYL